VENKPGRQYCSVCGEGLHAACPHCGFANDAGDRFCGGCGRELAASPSPTRFASAAAYTPKHLAEKILTSRTALEGERKQVTVLFADMKGSMELLADRDPEEARALLDPVLERMMEAVHRYEGTVNQVMGDGVMALFGAPVAHEDHAVRACYAALRLQEEVTRYGEAARRTHGIEIQARVGLNSGDVVVRTIGSDLQMDYTAVGHATHLAARMEQLATPGTIRLTADTLRLAEGYVEVRPLGPIPVKGLAEPVEAYELTGAGAVRSRLQAAAARGLTRFVGRDPELAQLQDALERARTGHGQIAAVVGEAGVGKSRLFWELTHSHRVHGWLVLESASVSYGKATAYLPLIELLRRYFGIEPRDDPRRVREKVTGKVLALDRALEPMLAGPLGLLDVPDEDPDWRALDPSQRRLRTLDAVKRLILRESQVQPVVLVFEDLHWIDGETQVFLDGLIESLPTARIVLLVNYRPEYRHGWGGKTYYRQLRIDPLPRETAGALLDALLGKDPALEPLKALLIERTEGNPLFLEESVRALVEARALTGEHGAYRMATPLPAIQVPATVQSVLAARIDRLPPEDKRLLQLASVVGKDVPLVLLRATAKLPDDDLARGLARLQSAEFLYEACLFPEIEYTFKHALTHEVAYQSLLHERRQTLHARIVETLETLYAGRLGEHVEHLAHHAARGAVWPKAAGYLREAGARALARSANREAADCFEQALAALRQLPETPETQRDALDALLALGTAVVASKGAAAPEVEATYRRAQELGTRVGDASRLFPAMWGRWYFHYSRGEYTRALELAQSLLAVAEGGGISATRLEAHHCLWATLTGKGDPGTAQTHLQAGLALYDRELHQGLALLYGGHDPGVCCRCFLSWTRWELGHPDQARESVQDALRLAAERSQAVTSAIAHSFATFVHYHRGEREVAAGHVDAMVQITQEHGLAAWADQARVLQSVLRVARGESPVEAVVRAKRLSLPTTLRLATWRASISLGLLADAYHEAGHPERGLEALAEAWEIAGGEPVGFYAPELHRLRGELRLARDAGAAPEAEACFRRALDLARGRQARSFELRAAMSLARLGARRARSAGARGLLAECYGTFNEGFDTADLREARALLDNLS
jgi:class 3 adenylate cyclase/predicted ATPase